MFKSKKPVEINYPGLLDALMFDMASAETYAEYLKLSDALRSGK